MNADQFYQQTHGDAPFLSRRAVVDLMNAFKGDTENDFPVQYEEQPRPSRLYRPMEEEVGLFQMMNYHD